jgi:hypothetical protein
MRMPREDIGDSLNACLSGNRPASFEMRIAAAAEYRVVPGNAFP